MAAVGIICEYNPFHKGHEWQLHILKGRYGAEHIVALMSGNFVQRGEPALFDKFARAEAALRAGVDLVLEIPPIWSSSSAREFAAAGAALAAASGIVDSLAFGVEDNVNTEELLRGADIYRKIYEDDGEWSEKLLSGLKTGMSYPEAAAEIFGDLSGDGKLARRLSKPGNILALEYINALKGTGIGIIPIERDLSFSSSSHIRDLIAYSGIEAVRDLIPEYSYEICLGEAARGHTVRAEDMSVLLGAGLIDAAHGLADPEIYLDVSHDMAARLRHCPEAYGSFGECLKRLKTRQYTLTRVRRALMHIMLKVSREEFEERKAEGYISYIRILGFRESAAAGGLMKMLRERAAVPLVAKPADHKDLIDRDARIDEMYYLFSGGPGEYLRSPITV